MEPKHFLVRMGTEATEKHREQLKETKTECVKTSTGARLCFFSYDKREIEAVEIDRIYL